MIDENKETHYYNMKVSSWDEALKSYVICNLMESISIENCY